MKKFLSTLLTFTLILSIIPITMVSANDDYFDKESVLTQLGIIDFASSDDTLSRMEFAYSLSKVLTSEVMPNCNTVFSDVTQSNAYSGYVAYLYNRGIVHGDDDATFSPDDDVSISSAYKMIISAMGYDVIATKLGGYPNGYLKEAATLGLTNGITSNDESLSKADAITLLYNALTISYDKASYDEDGNIITKNDSSTNMLYENLGIVPYKATITSVNDSASSATVTIEKSLLTNDIDKIKDGSTVTLSVPKQIDVHEYEYAPAKIYVQDEQGIVAIVLQDDVDVRYESIWSVNGDETEGNKYEPEFIERITFKNDKKTYKFDDDAVFFYNEQQTIDPVDLIGNFARVVLVENKIHYISAWDLTDAGILTGITTTDITYKNDGNRKLEDLNKYDRVKVYIDGSSEDISLLKPNTYFQYFSIKDDTLVIVASEKLIIEALTSVSDDTVTIGGITYDKADKVYVAKDDGDYIKNGNINALLDYNVKAYFNYANEVVYIAYDEVDDEMRIPDEFLGAVYRYERSEDDDDADIILKVHVLEPTIVLKEYKITDKTKYHDNVTLNDVLDSYSKCDGSNIFLFRAGSSGNLAWIGAPEPYKLSSNQTTRTIGERSSFPNDSNLYVTINNKTVYYGTEQMVLISKFDGEYDVREIAASSVQYKSIPSSASIEFFGKDDDIDIRLIAIYGDDLGDLYDTPSSFGIIDKRNTVYNDDKCTSEYEYEIIGKSKSTFTTDLDTRYSNFAFVIYHNKVFRGSNNIVIDKMVDLNQSNWESNGLLVESTIDKMNSKAIRFATGQTYFINNRVMTYLQIDTENKNEVKSITIDDINEGDTVYYCVSAIDGVTALTAIILIK